MCFCHHYLRLWPFHRNLAPPCSSSCRSGSCAKPRVAAGCPTAQQLTKGNNHSCRDPNSWGCKTQKLARVGDTHHSLQCHSTTVCRNSVKLHFQYIHPETGVTLLQVMPAHCFCPTCALLYVDSINIQTFLEGFPTVTHTPA